jgi:hypothetical protein
MPTPPTDGELAQAGYTRDQYDALITRIVGSWTLRLAAIDERALRVVLERPDVDHIDFADEHFWDGTPDDTLVQAADAPDDDIGLVRHRSLR